MFSQSSSSFHAPDNATDRIRQPLTHSASQSSHHGPSFSVGGMVSSTTPHHPHSTSSWASNNQSGTLSSPMNDPFLQPRSNYQSGYLMVCHLSSPNFNLHLFTVAYLQSMSQNNVRKSQLKYSSLDQCHDTHRLRHRPTNGLTTCLLYRPKPSLTQHSLVRPRANLVKTQCLRARGEHIVFLFDIADTFIARQRQTSDEDAPPTTSVNDILNATYTDSPSYLQRSVGAFTFIPSDFYPTTYLDIKL
jgi:nuclear pore complex protein Nup53